MTKHEFFNTNNLWVNLAALKAAFDKYGGVLPLPVIKNSKTVDPRDKASQKVLQLETAMGAAIECFKGAQAILIPRTRFAPVKTTNDLLALSSDAYEVTADKRMVLKAERNGTPPDIKLDGMYKFVDQLATLVPPGCTPSSSSATSSPSRAPSCSRRASSSRARSRIVGAAEGPPKVLKAGTYKDKLRAVRDSE